MTTVALVALVGILGMGSVAAVVLVLRLLGRTSRDRGAEVRAAHPDAVLGPELGQYRGGTGDFPRTRNTSWIVLTPTGLVSTPILGSTVVVPMAEVSGTRLDTRFNTHWNGRPVLVVETARGEVGITVADPERWRSAIAEPSP